MLDGRLCNMGVGLRAGASPEPLPLEQYGHPRAVQRQPAQPCRPGAPLPAPSHPPLQVCQALGTVHPRRSGIASHGGLRTKMTERAIPEIHLHSN